MNSVDERNEFRIGRAGFHGSLHPNYSPPPPPSSSSSSSLSSSSSRLPPSRITPSYPSSSSHHDRKNHQVLRGQDRPSSIPFQSSGPRGYNSSGGHSIPFDNSGMTRKERERLRDELEEREERERKFGITSSLTKRKTQS